MLLLNLEIIKKTRMVFAPGVKICRVHQEETASNTSVRSVRSFLSSLAGEKGIEQWQMEHARNALVFLYHDFLKLLKIGLRRSVSKSRPRKSTCKQFNREKECDFVDKISSKQDLRRALGQEILFWQPFIILRRFRVNRSNRKIWPQFLHFLEFSNS